MSATLIYSEEYIRSHIFYPAKARSVGIEPDIYRDPETDVPTSANIAANMQSSPKQYSDNDLYWMSRIIEAEAKGESYAGKIEVGACIVNRVKSNLFPGTVYDVIFDTANRVQYQPVSNGAIYNTPSDDSINAAKDVLSGNFANSGAMYFCSVRVADTAWAAQNRRYCKTVGGHVFYY